jgi:hypothetical protein
MTFPVSRCQKSMPSLAIGSISPLSKTRLIHFITRSRGCNKIAATMANEAAWVKQARSSIEMKPLDMWSPGPGELLVANESISFNPIEARIQKSSPLPSCFAISGDYKF